MNDELLARNLLSKINEWPNHPENQIRFIIEFVELIRSKQLERFRENKLSMETPPQPRPQPSRIVREGQMPKPPEK